MSARYAPRPTTEARGLTATMHTQYNGPPEQTQGATDRGSADSRPQWERRLARLPEYATTSDLRQAWVDLLRQFHWDLFGTLTFRNDTHPEAALKLFRLFISQLNRKLYGPRWSKHGKGIAWCVALERQLRGVLHLHCLLAEPELTRLLKSSWFRENGHWANALNEAWNALAGFARIEPIKQAQLVAGYVSKYVIKGGEIDLGGPLQQRRLEQATVQPDANLGQRGPCGLVMGSASVPGLPGTSGQPVDQVGQDAATASHLSSRRGCLSSSRGLVIVAQENSVNAGAQSSSECAPVSKS